ncbi:hypothetical protein PAMP_001623 [Pampus punctatissimus]
MEGGCLHNTAHTTDGSVISSHYGGLQEGLDLCGRTERLTSSPPDRAHGGPLTRVVLLEKPKAAMIYYDLPTLRIKVELTEGENDPWLVLTITLSFSIGKMDNVITRCSSLAVGLPQFAEVIVSSLSLCCVCMAVTSATLNGEINYHWCHLS